MAQYNGSMKVQKQSARKRAILTVPEKQKQSALEFAAAVHEYAPRVEGQRPDRIPYIRSNGELTFPDRSTAKGAAVALYQILKAEDAGVAVEVEPTPNPNGGPNLWRVLGYVAGSRKARAAAGFSAL